MERLLKCWTVSNLPKRETYKVLSNSIRAVELHEEAFNSTKTELLDLLSRHGIRRRVASKLLDRWLVHGDFLISEFGSGFTHVVGNPPYVRQERVPDVLMAEYRSRFRTIYDRADLYIPFIEYALMLLADKGVLGFICSDRWTKNKYGKPLRELVSRDFRLKYYVDMVDTPAFHSSVSAYPAIIVLDRDSGNSTRVLRRPEVNAKALKKVAAKLKAKKVAASSPVVEVSGVAMGAEPWILQSFDLLNVVRKLEATYPTIEDAGCKVGIGVATGADRIFVGKYDQLSIEEDRKLPLAVTKDLQDGEIVWSGLGVVNPFSASGKLVNLSDYPKLASHLEDHSDEIRKRNCARRNPQNWYRTIDRIYPDLADTPKLLIPDIKGDADIVYESGNLYPHHNLYYITSDHWDLLALRFVLLSGIARLFVSIYSTEMRGGYFRFQAQYLRRIRLPAWGSFSEKTRKALVEAGKNNRDRDSQRLVQEVYELNDDDWALVESLSREGQR